MATDNEQVRYDILIEAKEAIRNLREIMKTTEDNTTKMHLFNALVLDSAQKWKMSWQQSLLIYKQLNAELAKQKKGSLFGQTGGQDIAEMSNTYLQAAENAGRLGYSVADTSKKATEMGDNFEKSGKRAARGIDVIRIALGVLVSMLIFRAIQAVENFFRQAIEQATQFEETLYRLRNVEESLSMQGIEITMDGLKQGISEIQKLLPIFSKEDVSGLVGSLAISTKQLGLSEQQIIDLSRAVAILNIRSEKQEDLMTTGQHILSSILTNNAKGISALGIAFTDNTMRAMAMKLGFLEAGEALSELSENEKGLTKLNIILESTAQETANVGDYLETNSAKIKQNEAAWKDLQVTVGQTFLPFIPMVTGFIDILNDAFQVGKVAIIEFMTLFGTLGVVMAGVLTGRISDFKTFNDTIENSITTLRETLTNKFFLEQPEDAPEWFKRGWGDLIKEEADTATGPVQDLGEAIDEVDLEEFQNKIEDILEDTARAREDLAEKLNRKLDDLDEEYRRKALDAERDYLRDVEDINRDADRDREEALEDQRREDLKNEQEYQLKLWELRQRFLMDLDDALHARDARQILRLIKQYNIDKEALERRHNLEEQEREDNQQAELEDIEFRRQQRLEDAKREYQEKLADQRLAKQRELDDLNLWYAREQADIELAQQRKMETLIRGWIEEKKITEANAAEVYGILAKYFGPGGMTDSLYQYMMDSLIASTAGAIQAAASSMTGMIGGGVGGGGMTVPLSNSGGSGNKGGSGGGSHGRAEGTTLLATRPTRQLFGENGPELVKIMPLNRLGRNENNLSLNGNAGLGVNGTIRVAVDLSPDLEGRIVEQSMNSVADVMASVNRSKV